MRYLLDTEGYIAIASSNRIECESQRCIGYKGTIPEGYSSVEEWATNANIRAYYIDDNGNLALDEARLETLENCLTYCQSDYSGEEKIIGEWFGETLYRKVIEIGAVSTTEVVTNTAIENLKQVTDLRGGGTMNAGQFLHFGFQNAGGFCSCYYDQGRNATITTVSTTAYNLKSAYAILEYTKTVEVPKIEFVGGSGANIFVSDETLHINDGNVEINDKTIIINEEIVINEGGLTFE